MSNISILLILVMLLAGTPGTSSAQDNGPKSNVDSTSALALDAKHFVEAGLGLLMEPFLFDRQDWGRVGLAAGGTVLLFITDKGVKDFTLRNTNHLNDRIFNLDSYQGNEYSFILAGGIYAYGALTGNSRVRRTGLNAAEAFLYSGLITNVFKALIGSRRPYAGDGHRFLGPLQISKNDYQSLPSGHTTVSFAVSTVLAKSMGNLYWKSFWYGTAGLVGVSRMYHNKHWLSDVFLGAVIGYAVGDYVTGFDRKEQPRLFGKRIQPYVGTAEAGVCIFLN